MSLLHEFSRTDPGAKNIEKKKIKNAKMTRNPPPEKASGKLARQVSQLIRKYGIDITGFQVGSRLKHIADSVCWWEFRHRNPLLGT
jgi:hypothetical protein